MKKIILIILLIFILCSCGAAEESPVIGVIPGASDSPEPPPPEPSESGPPDDESAPTPSAVPPPVPTAIPEHGAAYIVGAREVSRDEFKYLCLTSLVNLLAGYGGDAAIGWDTTIEGMPLLEYTAYDALEMSKLYAALEIIAEIYGAELSAEVQAELDALHENSAALMGGQEQYDAFLESQGMTREVYEYIFFISSLYDELYRALCNADNGALLAADAGESIALYAEENEFITVMQIAILTIDPETFGELDAEALSEKQERVNEAASRLGAGEDFYDLAYEYSEDYIDPVTFTRGEMVQAFEDAAYALETGEISSPVKTSYGWHIIMRMETDLETVWSEHYSFELFDELAYSYIDELTEIEIDPVDYEELRQFLSRFVDLAGD